MADDTAQSTPPKRQPLPPEEPLLEPRAIPNPNAIQGRLDCYGDALFFSFILQGLLCFFSAMIMDGGLAKRYCLLALGPYWVGALIIMLRRPQAPSATFMDQVFIRFGYLFCLAGIVYYWPVAAVIESWWWQRVR
jgi:hypothetical protein